MPDPIISPSISPYSARIGSVESSGDITAQNPLYPASKGGPLGLHQFLRSTWLDFAKARPDLFAGQTPEEVLAGRTNPRLSAAAADWSRDYNSGILAKAGILPTPTNLALAHTLGAGGAIGALKYSDDTPLTKVFQETQPKMADTILKLNPAYQNMTVGDLKGKFANVDTAPPAPAPAQTAQATPPPFYPMQPAQSALATKEPDPLQQLALVNSLMKPVGQPMNNNMNTGVLQALVAANANRSGLPAGYGQGLANPLLT